MLINKYFFAVSLLLTALLPGVALADAIVRSQAMKASTIAEFFIEDEQVRVELEVGINDLPAFQNILPDSIYEKMGFAPRPVRDRLAEFFARDFFIIADGKPLTGHVVEMAPAKRIRRDDITGEPLSGNEEKAETVLQIILLFPFKSRPAKLVLFAPKKAPTHIGFVAYHKKLPINDFRYLGNGYTLTLDWEDSWYSSFNARALRRQYFSPMSGFLYIEPYEVRKEIIVRPKDLQQWVDLGLEDKEVIDVASQAAIKKKVIAFLENHFPTAIDGQPVNGEVQRINFLTRTLKTSTVVDNQELDVLSATLGIIYTFPTRGLPDNVTMEWTLWNDRMVNVSAATVDQAGPFPVLLQRDWRTLEWKNFLKNPVLPTLVDIGLPPNGFVYYIKHVIFLLVAIGVIVMLVIIKRKNVPVEKLVVGEAGLILTIIVMVLLHQHYGLNEQKSEKLVSALLHNVYRAFDFRKEEDIYDTLDKSVSGDLLTDIYLEIRKGLVLANQGGARAKVKEVALQSIHTDLLGDHPGIKARCVWNIYGSVGHWGHVHQRANQYEGDLVIEEIGGQWKLTALNLLQEQRL